MAAPTIPYTIPGTVDGDRPEIVCRVSFDGAATPDPLVWVDMSDRLRSFSVDRGGENELELVDTGTASVVLDNNDRALDPFNTSSPYSPDVRPRRRLWLQGQWDGATHDLFYGWTGAFKPEWPGVGFDNVVAVEAQDAFAIASGDALPTTSPPRDTWADLVMSDTPDCFWRFNHVEAGPVPDDGPGGKEANPSSSYGTYFLGEAGAVVGDRANVAARSTSVWVTEDVEHQGFGDFAALSECAVEVVVKPNAAAVASGGTLWIGPQSNNATPFFQTQVLWNAGGAIRFDVRNAAGGLVTATSSGANILVGDTWSHIVCTLESGSLRIYLNGVSVATTGFGGSTVYAPVRTTAGTAVMTLNGIDTVTWDEAAIYRHGLTASRVTAHYEALVSTGDDQSLTSDRIVTTLEESGLAFVPRRIRTGAREILPEYFHGQAPKELLEDAVETEGVPALFFFGKDGAAVFLDRAHRSSSPWNTVQATFDDDGTDLPYADLETDEGEAFIYNDARVTAEGGELQRTFDTASIGEYQRRVLDRGETLNVNDTDAATEAAALLALFKDPLPRITRLTLRGQDHLGLLAQILGREIGDKVRVFRRPTGGGSAIDQSCWIRSISLSGDAQSDQWLTCSWSLAQR